MSAKEVNKGGRPETKLNKVEFEKLCSIQCTKLEICDYLDTTDKTLEKWCVKTYGKGFSEVFKLKRGKGKVSLRRSQWQMSEKVPAMNIWLGKNYLKQSDDGLKEDLETEKVYNIPAKEVSNLFIKNYHSCNNDTNITINRGGTSCFYKNQKVVLNGCSKEISNIKRGDFVLSWNEKLNKSEYKEVANVFKYKNQKETFEVILNNGSKIISTSDHKFYSRGGCYSLKHILYLFYKKNGESYARDMESNSKFFKIRSINTWKLKVNELQKHWESAKLKTSNIKRRLYANNDFRRFWKVLFVESTQVYSYNISWENRTKRSEPYKWYKNRQRSQKFRDSNQIRESGTRLQAWFNRAKTRFAKWNGEANGETSKRNQSNSKRTRALLWTERTIRKIRSFASSNKRDSNKAKEYLASLLNVNDISSFRKVKEDYVYDIEIKDNHNYYLDCGKNILVHNSTKTVSLAQIAMQFLLTGKIGVKEGKEFDIIGSTLPFVKSTAMKEFWKYAELYGLVDLFQHRKTEKQVLYKDRTLNYFSVDNEEKVRGRRRDFAHIPEADTINYDIFKQIQMRTNCHTFLDFNPSDEFCYINEELEKKRAKVVNDVKVIQSSYLDNPFLNDKIISEIELLKTTDKEYWQIFGLGNYGSVAGLIFTNWQTYDELPDKEFIEFYGLDLGYSNSKTAMAKVLWEKKTNNLYIKECFYQTGLNYVETEKNVRANNPENKEVYSDSSESRLVGHLLTSGVNVYTPKKEVLYSISLLQSFNLFIDKDSLNLIKEIKHYKWMKKAGHRVNEPLKYLDDLIDALRYATIGFISTHGSTNKILTNMVKQAKTISGKK